MSDQFFTNTKDLSSWIRQFPSGNSAADALVNAINSTSEDQSILDAVQNNTRDIINYCNKIHEENQNSDEDAQILYMRLSEFKLANIKKANISKGVCMKKEAQGEQEESRQRNNWVRGERNKWSRTIEGFNENTPWRRDRDKIYDFTHNSTDKISFSEDPSKVYSGEALWRMYIMDKFTREYQDKDGHWVGGYINDRFYVFPDAGTPSNPDVPRDFGNQMGLALGERTRKPKSENWSVERRMEDARGNKTADLEVSASSFTRQVKTASANIHEAGSDRVYNIFRDVLGMREDGLSYEKRLELISDHYNTKINHVAQIEKEVEKLIKKHNGVGYKIAQTLDTASSPFNVQTKNGTIAVQAGDQYEKLPNGEIRLVSTNEIGVPDPGALESQEIHEAGLETGLVGDNSPKVPNLEEDNLDFPVAETK